MLVDSLMWGSAGGLALREICYTNNMKIHQRFYWPLALIQLWIKAANILEQFPPVQSECGMRCPWEADE